jgi:hypothetical protein
MNSPPVSVGSLRAIHCEDRSTLANVVQVLAPVDVASARRQLREQIARMERELADTLASTYPRILTAPARTAPQTARLLDLAELELARDALADRVSTVRRRVVEQAESQARARAKLEEMLARPSAYKGATVRNDELGLSGCTTYRVLPRLGPIGLLSGWWRVKISSGCPLPSAP